jgi:Low-density lipoprotein receptor repeat class B
VRRAGRVDARSIRVRRFAVALAALAVTVPALAARADAFVYWSQSPSAGNGLIGRANNADGSIVNFALLHNLFGAQGMAIDSNYIYWSNGPLEIGRANLDGSGTPNQSFIPGARTPTALAVDDTHGFIYWVDQRDETIGRASLSGGSTTVNNNLINAFGPPTGVAVDSTHGFVYWTVAFSASNGAIGRANLDGSSPTYFLLSNLFGAQGITLDSNYIYWAGVSSIGRTNLDGSGTPNQSFILGAREPAALAVDSTSVYWADQVDGTIGRGSITGGSTGLNNLFIDTLGNDTGVAADAKVLPAPHPGPQPPPRIARLVAGVQRLGLPAGTERSLLAKLDAAERSFDAGHRDAACGILGAYLHAVEAQSGHKLDVAPAAGLIADATAMRQALGCGAG